MYFSDDGDVLGMRYDNWKIVFMEQRCKGIAGGMGGPVRPKVATYPSVSSTCAWTHTSVPDITSLTPIGNGSSAENVPLMVYPATGNCRAVFLATFKEFPPAQKRCDVHN